MRDEDKGFEPTSAGVGGHGGRSVACGNAGNALHSQTARLRNSASHAIVFEGTGVIEPLMLERQMGEATVFRRARAAQQRGVALAQSNDMVIVVHERE